MYVTLTVNISDSKYAYAGTTGEAELKIELPEPVILQIDPSQMFLGLLQAAKTNFHKALDEKEKETLAAAFVGVEEEKDGIHPD